MKKCQGTFSYIFSPEHETTLKLLDFDCSLESKSDGLIIRNYWVPTDNLPFCLQYREIIDEDNALPNKKERSLNNLMPGLLESSDRFIKNNPKPTNEIQLAGIILEDTASIQSQISDWQIPLRVHWTRPDQNKIAHQLSYRKAYPFWAFLIICNSLKELPEIPYSQKIEWDNQEAIWIPMETTTFDFLIYEYR